MPSLWKILIIAALCLGIAPSWGAEESDPGLSEIVTLEGEIQLKVDKKEAASSEVETFVEPMKHNESNDQKTSSVESSKGSIESPLEPQTSLPETFLAESEPKAQPLSAQTSEPPGVLQSAESSVLESVGIKRLSKGINIFRFSTYYLKHVSPLIKERTLPESSVQ